MAYALPQTILMSDMECATCGIAYAVPDHWQKEKKRLGSQFFCPNGHTLFYRETEAQRLQKKLDDAARTNTQLAQQVRDAQIAEQKAVKETQRLKRRVHAGLCPCCNRTFQNLARHMATKHKDAT